MPLTRDHLSVIAAITPDGRLFSQTEQRAFNSADIIRFLRHLLQHISGRLLVIWDGLPAHRSRAIKAFLSAGAAQRIHLERLPGYAPDLNPAEGIWQYLKYVELKNLCTHTLLELRLELRKAIVRLRRKTAIVCACFDRVHLGERV